MCVLKETIFDVVFVTQDMYITLYTSMMERWRTDTLLGEAIPQNWFWFYTRTYAHTNHTHTHTYTHTHWMIPL